MVLVEVYSGEEMIWGGTMNGIPSPGSVVALNYPPVPTEVMTQPIAKFYRVGAVIWNVTDGFPIASAPPKLQVVEVDPNTGKPKQSLIQKPNITVH